MNTNERLLLNIGNTHTQVALAAGHEILAQERLATPDFLANTAAAALMRDHAALPCLVACVVPKAAMALHQQWPGRVIAFLSPLMVKDIDLSEVDTSTLGADRLANTLAGLAFVAPPYIVLDCGTAITTVVVDASGCFRGGAIMPGRRLWRKALHHFTGQLPEIDLYPDAPPPAGTNTHDALRSGIDGGILGAVQHILDTTRRYYAIPAGHTLAAGGDAPYFSKHLPDLLPTAPDFTLRGLLKITFPAVEASEEG